MTDVSAIVAGYDRLLASIGDRANDIEPRPVVTHWPHVGSAYRGLVIVGQAVWGWADDCQASELQSADLREGMIASIRSRVDKPEPLDWIETHPRRNTPFWKVARSLAETLEPDLDVPWPARFAWVNLYPSAPEDPPDNPKGGLRSAQDPHVGPLLRTVVETLQANRVIALVGSYWQPGIDDAGLRDLPAQPRPLLRAGRHEDRTWVIGWHPNGASHRRFGPGAYAQLIAQAVRATENDS